MRQTDRRRRKRIIHFIVLFWEVLLLGLGTGFAGLYLVHHMPLWADSAEEQHRTDEETPPAVKAEQKPEEGAQQEKIPDSETEALGEEVPKEEAGVFYREGAVAGEVTLCFAGDVLFDDSYSPMVSLKQRTNGVEDCFSEELLGQMREADLFILNNEFTFTDRGEPLPDKSYTFRSKPDNVKYLFEMGADLVSIANNHTFDFGEISLLDTLDTLTEAGMPYMGAGRNQEEASAPVYFEIEGIRIGFLAATQIERFGNPNTRGATDTLPGVFRCLDPEALYQAVRETKEKCDFVVVYVHWGTEKTTEPDWAQLEQGKGLAEAGADLIIGAHPHVLQGLESIRGIPVVYSLGNFWFNSFTIDSCLVKVTIDKEGLKSFRFLPALQKNCTTSLLQGQEKARVLSEIRKLSPHVIIDEEGNVQFEAGQER